MKFWLRGEDSNLRPLGYEPNELPTAPPRDVCRLIYYTPYFITLSTYFRKLNNFYLSLYYYMLFFEKYSYLFRITFYYTSFLHKIQVIFECCTCLVQDKSHAFEAPLHGHGIYLVTVCQLK